MPSALDRLRLLDGLIAALLDRPMDFWIDYEFIEVDSDLKSKKGVYDRSNYRIFDSFKTLIK